MKYILTVSNLWNFSDFDELIKNGVFDFRVNGIHLKNETLELLNSVLLDRRINVFYDLPGVKNRIWTSSRQREVVKAGSIMSICKSNYDNKSFYITGNTFWDNCKKGDIYHIRRVNRKPVELEILEVSDDKVTVNVRTDGIIGNGYHIYNPEKYYSNETLSIDDKMQMKKIDLLNPQVIAVSFADIPKIIEEARDYFGKDKKYYAKIESPKAIENIDELIDISDGIIIGRDDMSAYYSEDEIDNVIKMTLKKCDEKNKRMIGASNYLQNVYDTGHYNEKDVYDFNVLKSGEAFGLYINETNKDGDWRKYLNALNLMDGQDLLGRKQ